MEKLRFESGSVTKEIGIEDGRFVAARYVNAMTGKIVKVKEEFSFVYTRGKGLVRKLRAADFNARATSDGVSYTLGEFEVAESYSDKDGVLRKKLTLRYPVGISVFDVCVEKEVADKGVFCWSAPLAGRTFVPAKVARLGQPVYLSDMFFGLESPVGDNGAARGEVCLTYHNDGEPDACEDGVCTLSLPDAIVGSAAAADYESVRESFFTYLFKVARKPVFRVQYNSWYDNKLDISRERIEKSFSLIAQGAEKAGLPPLDCYVVDDGWTEYRKPLFWEFNDKFSGGFSHESALAKSLGSKFGVWFGPRGGYTRQTYEYAKLLGSIGYHVNERSRDVCTADPRYIDALCSRMARFCTLYDVDYFKIDGFAYTPCRGKDHGHAPAKGDALAFYTRLWKNWMQGFAKIRKVRPDVCLNVTSYAHCSPWFLIQADYVWMNNASDMGFAGKGGDMQRCLNYRDGRYRDLFVKRQYQFPASHLYNHEPTYAARNFASESARKANKPITYTDEEFSLYMKCCMMRGSGLAELYFSPEMMTDEKWRAAERELGFAKRNADVLGRSRFFGGRPERGEVYGYFACNGDKYILMLRNPSDRSRRYRFTLPSIGVVQGELDAMQIVFEDNLNGGERRKRIYPKM